MFGYCSVILWFVLKHSLVLELAQILASSGFRDTSGVGDANAELGVMMAKYNQEKLLRSLNNLLIFK